VRPKTQTIVNDEAALSRRSILCYGANKRNYELSIRMSMRDDKMNIADADRLRTRVVRFGSFQVDFQERDLYKCGLRLKLQQKPFQLLELLLERAGELITRKELTDRLWPGVYLNFERSLNTAMNSLRQTLGDTSRNPRFVETRPGLGYRFIAPVERVPNYVHRNQRTDGGKEPSEAHQDYLKGRHFYDKMTEDALRRSIAYFESALAADARYAPAHAGLADAYIMLSYFHDMPTAQALTNARERAAAALGLDEHLAEAHASLGSAIGLQQWDWDRAQTRFARAMELNPESATVHRYQANHLCAKGLTDQAVQKMRRALELEPLSLMNNASMAWTLYMTRDYEGAIDQSWKTLALEANFAAAQHTLGLAHEQLGEYEEAITEFRNAHSCSGRHPIALAALGHAYAKSGKQAEARNILGELDELSRRRSVSRYWIGLVHAALGEIDAALSELVRGVEERDVWMVWLGVEPRFDSLRCDERFVKLIRELRLVPVVGRHATQE
jgi:DNA-binding winged helix-turn-helix (wHTH) protein/Flp pilus assembly protein TadD